MQEGQYGCSLSKAKCCRYMYICYMQWLFLGFPETRIIISHVPDVHDHRSHWHGDMSIFPSSAAAPYLSFPYNPVCRSIADNHLWMCIKARGVLAKLQIWQKKNPSIGFSGWKHISPAEKWMALSSIDWKLESRTWHNRSVPRSVCE